jgi:hypothetical protein
MKNLLLFLSFFFFGHISAQNVDFVQLKNLIHFAYSEISLDNKIIALNFWSVDNNDSRICNKNFDKVYSIYESAKLKGGLKGIVVIAVDKNNLKSTSDIIFKKDGIQKILSLNIDAFENIVFDENTHNIVFDAEGKVLYKNIPCEQIFSSTNQLITR